MERYISRHFLGYAGEAFGTQQRYYGQSAVYGGETPASYVEDETTYAFSGWDASFDAITGDLVVTATYSAVE